MTLLLDTAASEVSGETYGWEDFSVVVVSVDIGKPVDWPWLLRVVLPKEMRTKASETRKTGSSAMLRLFSPDSTIREVHRQ